MNNTNGTDIVHQFAAYLRTALEHRQSAYVMKEAKRVDRETSLEDYQKTTSLSEETDYTAGLDLKDQMEDSRLVHIMSQLSPLDCSILYHHVLQGLPYDEVAAKIGYNRWTVKSRYLRMVKKFRNI